MAKGPAKKSRLTIKRMKAFWRLMRGKMVREKMSANRVAAGWALGMFVGCAIPFGFQLIISVPISVIARVSKLGATLGTFITNPITIFFIYPAQTWVVHRILFASNPQMPSEWTWQAVKVLAGRTIASFFIGGVLLGIILSPIMFFFSRRAVLSYRAALERRKAKKSAAHDTTP